MKLSKQYRIPRELIDKYAKLPINRSAAMSMAVITAEREPGTLNRALSQRATQPNGFSPTVKVSVTMDPRVVKALDNMSQMTKLPIEHVLRLAMEAYLE